MAEASESREIRVFISSTIRDFMEERDLLVKQVFPDLRRKAREQGVEVVDVDLRWGITEEESRQYKVIPICLGEIDRCRPYFVGMLGERYGWIPPASQYSPQVIERQPWLTQHLGGVSVTELEILHGVLNDPAMAGRAFFYFHDSAWSTSQSAPGFVCEIAEEEAKLADHKKRIRNSRFPVVENIPDPKALADQIGRDLWDLIEQQYPDLDEADALEREERQHASYRRSRLGVYLGGKRSINQLERWIDAGHQKILITGESGAGKSTLIASWIEAHQQHHPEDVVLAHHLGCSNDASAIRPLLARLIDTAKQQLPEVYGYSLSVPQDWWELMVKQNIKSLTGKSPILLVSTYLVTPNARAASQNPAGSSKLGSAVIASTVSGIVFCFAVGCDSFGTGKSQFPELHGQSERGGDLGLGVLQGLP